MQTKTKHGPHTCTPEVREQLFQNESHTTELDGHWCSSYRTKTIQYTNNQQQRYQKAL